MQEKCVFMTFWEQTLSTLIGVIAGFVFSIIVFYLTERWKNSRVNKNLSANLQKEFEFNINFIEKYRTEFEKLIRKVSANDKQPFIVFRFNRLQRLFILEAFSKGLLYKHLSADEINELDLMLSYFTIAMDQLHYNYLDEYKIGKCTQADSLAKFEFNKEEIDKYLKLTKTLKEKLKKLK